MHDCACTVRGAALHVALCAGCLEGRERILCLHTLFHAHCTIFASTSLPLVAASQACRSSNLDSSECKECANAAPTPCYSSDLAKLSSRRTKSAFSMHSRQVAPRSASSCLSCATRIFPRSARFRSTRPAHRLPR